MSRQAWMPDRSLQERLARAIDSMAPGSARGRIAQASPVRPHAFPPVESLDDEMGVEQIQFCNTDYTIATGPGLITLKLSHIPLDGSLHVRWNGLDQPLTEWSVNSNIVTIPDAQRHIRPGDFITAAYAYIEDAPVSESVDFTMIGSNGYDSGAGSGAVTSLALPAGTQAGDAVVLVAIGGWSGTGHAHVTDGRFQQLWGGLFYGRDALIHHAVLGSDLSAIQMDVLGTSGDPTGQFVGILAVTLRGANGPVKPDARLVQTAEGSPTSIPALGGGGSGAIAVNMKGAGIGGVHGTSFGSPYTGIAGNGIYVGADIATCSSDDVPAAALSNVDTHMTVAFGLAYA